MQDVPISRMIRLVTLVGVVMLLAAFAGLAAQSSASPPHKTPAPVEPRQEPRPASIREEGPPPSVSVEEAEVEVLPQRCGDVPINPAKIQQAVTEYVRTDGVSLTQERVAGSLVVVACVYPSPRLEFAPDIVDLVVLIPKPIQSTDFPLPPECRPPEKPPALGVVVPLPPGCAPPPLPEQSASSISMALPLAQIR